MKRSGGVRVGVVGCGAIARAVHLPTLVDLPGVSVVGVADPHPAARDAAQRIATGARAFETVQEMLGAGALDAVVLAMPSPLHAATAAQAFEAGCHVYVEKPVATTVPDAQTLLDAWTRSGRLGVAGFNYRQHPLVQQARALVSAGVIGDVIAMQTVFSSPGPTASAASSWRQRDDSGGALFDLGAHHVDLAAFLIGAYPESVMARWSSSGSSDRPAGNGATFEGVFANGATMQSAFTFDAVGEDRITLLGEKGRLSFDRLAGVSVERSHGAADRALLRRALAMASIVMREPFARVRLLRPDAEPSFRRALSLFVDSVRAWPEHTTTTLPTIADGVRCLDVLLAAREAAASGAHVTVRRIADLVPSTGEH